MSKLASQATLCYNRPRNIVVLGGACNTPNRIHRTRRCTMTTVPHSASNDNSPFVTIPVGKDQFAIVDPGDADLGQVYWGIDPKGRVRRGKRIDGKYTTIAMHRVILERKLGRPILEGMFAEHVNGDKLDNRRENLHEVLYAQRARYLARWAARLSLARANDDAPYIIIPVGKGNRAIVDREDVDLAQWSWAITSDGYADRGISQGKSKTSVRMHRVILERKLGRPILPNMQVDHRNGNTLDNRRANLREATGSQNQANQRRRKKSSCVSYKGVVVFRNDKWQARISYQGYRHQLGVFDTPLEAAQAYDQAALELFGEYACTNDDVVQMTWQSVISKPGQLKGKDHVSGFRGVEKMSLNRWVATIGINGKRIRLGTFADKEDAARAYDRALIALKGKNALTNFPLEDYGLEVDK